MSAGGLIGCCRFLGEPGIDLMPFGGCGTRARPDEAAFTLAGATAGGILGIGGSIEGSTSAIMRINS